MTISTKYSKGDEVWAVNRGKARHYKVLGIIACIGDTSLGHVFTGTSITYRVYDNGDDVFDVKEEFCFPDKQSLIASL